LQKKLSEKHKEKELRKTGQNSPLNRKEAYSGFIISFKPLLIAVLLWLITIFIFHLPAIKNEVALFFIGFTLNSALVFGNLLFISVESATYPLITVEGYTMKVVMECTAYNFYIFIIYLSLLSPVSWKKRILTMVIFIAVLFISNNLRLILMGYIGLYYENLFHYIHNYLWDYLFGFIIFLIWVWRFQDNLIGEDLKEKE